jgi:hypothetical protein
MWNFISKVSSQVGEVLAPSVRTPLDDFKEHWRSIRSFYLDKKGTLRSLNQAKICSYSG